MNVSDHVRTSSADLPAEDILRASVDVLLGVEADAKAALAAINIRTVFDLATSRLFAVATALLAAETDASTLEARMNGAAADAVVPPPGIPVSEWARQDLTILAGVAASEATALKSALSIDSVRDLALWPPYLAAGAILDWVLGTADPSDRDAPDDLLPRSGVYPTERVFYSKLLIDLAPQPDNGVTALEQAGAVDLGAALAAPAAFQRIATGAMVRFRQSWYSEGVTLGQMLHSLTLAPGESTRVAMIDWLRQVGATVTEQIDEREQLTDTQTHNRALSEVTDATASEFQSGSSSTHVDARSSQSGSALGLEIGPLALGESGGGGSSKTSAMSASSSFGARDLAASLAQNINDRTQQNASSARSRRASIVSEVSQAEHEAITTRVVTNYNHMHALNVQYFEVVQAYRVTTEMDRADRCLFVPLKLIDFTNPDIVDRLRATLAEAALTPSVFRQLTSEYGTVEVIPKTPRIVPGRINLGAIVANIAAVAPTDTAARIATPTRIMAESPELGRRVIGTNNQPDIAVAQPNAVADAAQPAATLSLNERFLRAPAVAPAAVAAAKGWDLDQVARLGSLMTGVPLRRGSDTLFLPDDAVLLSIELREGQAAKFQVRTRDNSKLAGDQVGQTGFVLAEPAAIGELQAIALQSLSEHDQQTSLALNLNLKNAVITLDVPIQFRAQGGGTALQDVIAFGPLGPSPALLEHLEANRLHYSQKVFATLDSATLAGLLGQFSYKGLPLAQVVDPKPLALTANFLVFRVNVPRSGQVDDQRLAAEQAEFGAFLKSRGLDAPAPQSEIVPLPTGGVFAEAVLGRFNSAEKVDLKRFWNWQDSPIPIAAPDIAPVTAGSRAEADNVAPGQLGTPIVSIQAPTALPAAAGVGPILQAIQNASLFRDMSGLAQTAALAQSAVATTSAGATAAGAQAAKTLFTVMDENTQRMRIAADLVGSMMGAGGGGGKSQKGATTVSEQGGQLNAAQSLAQKSATGPGGSSGESAANSATGGTGAAGTPAGSATATASGLEQQTLAQQTGSGGATAAGKIVAAATAPDTVQPTAAQPPAKPATPPPAPVPEFPAPVPLHFRLNLYFEPTDGVAIEGNRQMYVSENVGFSSNLLVEVAGGKDQSLFAGFQFTPITFLSSLSVKITAQATSQGGALEGTKPITLPSTLSDITVLTMHVQPVLKVTTLTIATSAPFTPDLTDLDNKLTALGIPKVMRVANPTFAIKDANTFTAVVRSFTGELIITQTL